MPILVRGSDDLEKIAALIIPSGESIVMGSLSLIKGMLPSLRNKISSGIPTVGTCAGMIMMGKRTFDRVVGKQIRS
ncbi:MAG TPA: hypothetical protein VFF30_06835 [Nitrososphaerales archaeon]|nr:hypothetical protein [Nitrososphaerales archaeon]